jgi:hypothetical protein
MPVVLSLVERSVKYWRSWKMSMRAAPKAEVYKMFSKPRLSSRRGGFVATVSKKGNRGCKSNSRQPIKSALFSLPIMMKKSGLCTTCMQTFPCRERFRVFKPPLKCTILINPCMWRFQASGFPSTNWSKRYFH